MNIGLLEYELVSLRSMAALRVAIVSMWERTVSRICCALSCEAWLHNPDDTASPMRCYGSPHYGATMCLRQLEGGFILGSDEFALSA